MQIDETNRKGFSPGYSHSLKLQLREIGNRLKFYLERRGLNLATLQHHSGLNLKQLQKIIDGKKYPVKNLMPLLETLQDMNGRWLIYGEGEMLKKHIRQQNQQGLHRLVQLENARESASKRDAELTEALNTIVKNQKKLLKQNRKIMSLLKAAAKR